MHQAPLVERQELSKWTSACGAWAEAIEILKLLITEEEENRLSPSHRHALRVALFVLYGRPFKQRGYLRVSPDEIVPGDKVGIHSALIVLRDRMYAHSDTDFTSSIGEELNRTIVVAKPRAFAFGMNQVRPQKGACLEYLGFIEGLQKTAVYRRDKVFRRWRRHLRLPFGSQWIINAGTSSNDALLRLLPENLRGFSHRTDQAQVE